MANLQKEFNINLAEVVSEFNLNPDQIKQLGALTANREIANIKLGYGVYYRRETIERLFGNGK